MLVLGLTWVSMGCNYDSSLAAPIRGHWFPHLVMPMFSPSQDDVRRFFCQVMERSRMGEPMDALQTLAAQWIDEHPEFHEILSDPAWALKQTYPVEAGHANPFLHLSMHLSISEQCSIDQPQGIQAAVAQLAERKNSIHDAQHAVMECLGAMLWESQRSGRPPDGAAYVDAIKRLVSHD